MPSLKSTSFLPLSSSVPSVQPPSYYGNWLLYPWTVGTLGKHPKVQYVYHCSVSDLLVASLAGNPGIVSPFLPTMILVCSGFLQSQFANTVYLLYPASFVLHKTSHKGYSPYQTSHLISMSPWQHPVARTLLTRHT